MQSNGFVSHEIFYIPFPSDEEEKQSSSKIKPVATLNQNPINILLPSVLDYLTLDDAVRFAACNSKNYKAVDKYCKRGPTSAAELCVLRNNLVHLEKTKPTYLKIIKYINGVIFFLADFISTVMLTLTCPILAFLSMSLYQFIMNTAASSARLAAHAAALPAYVEYDCLRSMIGGYIASNTLHIGLASVFLGLVSVVLTVILISFLVNSFQRAFPAPEPKPKPDPFVLFESNIFQAARFKLNCDAAALSEPLQVADEKAEDENENRKDRYLEYTQTVNLIDHATTSQKLSQVGVGLFKGPSKNSLTAFHNLTEANTALRFAAGAN
jgi:hypothetical protein